MEDISASDVLCFFEGLRQFGEIFRVKKQTHQNKIQLYK